MSIFKDLVSLGFLNYCTYEVEGEEKDIYIYIYIHYYINIIFIIDYITII